MSDYDSEELELGEEEEVFVEQKSTFELLSTPHELEDQEIRSVVVQNNVLCVLGQNGRFLGQDQMGGVDTLDADVHMPHKLFVDPVGTHVIVSCTSGECYYFNMQLRTRLRFNVGTGQVVPYGNPSPGPGAAGRSPVVESVGWDKHMEFEPSTTGNILLGTREGHKVFQLIISVDGGGSGKLDDCREIAVLPVGDDRNPAPGASAIIAIEMEMLNDQRFVMAATPCNLYGVAGTEFDSYEEIFQEPAFVSVNMPMVEGTRGAFSIFRSIIGEGKLTSPPHSFVWASSIGILHGVFARSVPQKPGQEPDPLISHQETIYFGARQEGGFRRLPQDAVHSSFHMYVVHDDKLQVLAHPAGLKWVPPDGISLKWEDFQEKIKFAPFQHRVTRTRGVVWDETKRKAYCYNNTHIWEINVEREHAGFWKPFLERAVDPAENHLMRVRYFDAAMRLTGDIPPKRDIVSMHFGRYWLKKAQENEDDADKRREYGLKACAVLDKCSRFEEVYHLLAQKMPDILLPYIENRYKYLVDRRKAGCEKSQIACLVAVVVTMFLGEAARTRVEKKKKEKCDQLTAHLHSANVHESSLFADERFYLMIHNLVAAHGYDDVILDLAKDLKRWRYTVGYSATKGKFEEAVAVLDAHCQDKPDVWIEFAPTLMKERPVQLLDSMRRTPVLTRSLHKFLPAFLAYSKKNNEENLKYPDHLHTFLFNTLQGKMGGKGAADDMPLSDEDNDDEFGNGGNHNSHLDDGLGTWDVNSTTLKNFYVSLLINNQSYMDELLTYLEHSDEYTYEFALHLCLEHKLRQACVVLYRHLNFPEEAVEVALEIGHVDEATEIVRTLPAETESATRKRVWMLLVGYYVEHGKVKEAIDYINTSGVLRLEDVLEKVTDTTVIQGFKDPICERLDFYAKDIKELTEDMTHATESAKSIKDDIACLKARYGYVSSSQRCEICHKTLLHGSQPFLVYPSCRHVCHEHCVVEHLKNLGGLEYIARKCPEPGYLDGIHNEMQLAEAECIFCGECAILEIDAPFIVAGGDRTWAIE